MAYFDIFDGTIFRDNDNELGIQKGPDINAKFLT